MFQKEYQTRFNSELYGFCVNLDNLIASKKPFNRVKATNELIEQIYNTALKLVDYQMYVDWQYRNYKKKYVKDDSDNDLATSNISNEQKHKKGKHTQMISSKSKADQQHYQNIHESFHEKTQEDELILIKTLLKQEDVSKKIQDAKVRLSQDHLAHKQLSLTLNGLENQEKDLKLRETNFKNDLANVKNNIIQYQDQSKIAEQELQQQISAQQELINNLNKQQEINAAHFKEQIEIATEVGKKQLFEQSSEGARKSAAQEDLCNQLSRECSIFREQLSELKGQHQQLVAKLQLLHSTNKDASSRLEANYQNWTVQLENEYQEVIDAYDNMVAEQIRANEELTDLKLAKDDNELKDLENQKAQTLANFINELKNEIQSNKQAGIELSVENRQLREQLQAQEQERDNLIKKGKELDLLKEGKERIMLETTLKIIHQMREENDIIKRKLKKERELNSKQRDTIRSFMVQSPAGQRRNFDVEKQLEILTQRVSSKSQNKRQHDMQKKIDDIQQVKMAKMERMLAINHLREQYLYNAQINNIASGQNQTTFREKQMQDAYKQHKYNQTKASSQPRNLIKVHQKIF